ncbi:MAG: NAD(P)H-dependent oxidoreductase [Pigmentiphaga sp.]|uniref:NADPH-dependent FMN reductase n=1 Tax=Pigmentiphaga sp. TaxID=1977564 RepID=UPI0029AD171B|nr:NAD(P)H-dependent oxidoreductase [Pigmentiphaga sp.]MDX3907977.1 NAD(P)H-dependent oxidoreductase [Pigmentiphaga sp.]
MEQAPLIVGLGGTTRAGSSSEKALAVSLRAAEREGAQVVMLAGPQLDLPMYAPERPERCDAARRLVALLRRCDGLIIASPSYHGTISGMLKNALDYTEDLSRDHRVYFDDCAIGLIACGAGWQGAGQALVALRAIAHSLRGWPTPLGAVLNTSTPLFDDSGACREPSAAFQLECVGRQVVQFARMKKALARVPSLAET